ncbi:MAG: sensor histidine kinase [Anaerolineales bacterium]|jgi:signal transduction histidine kinase
MINSKSTSSKDQSSTRWWGIARAAWYVVAALTLVMVIIAIPGYIRAVPEGFSVVKLTANPSPVVVAINTLAVLFSIATVLLSIYLAFLLFRRRPKDRMALFLSFFLLIFAAYSVPIKQLESVSTITSVPSIVWNGIFTPLIMFPASVFLFLLFPDGRFAPRWSRWVAIASLITAPVGMITFLIWVRSDPRPLEAQVFGSIFPVVIMLGVVYAQFYRYRHLATGQQRQQIKWVVYGLGIMLFLLIVSAYPYFRSFTLPADTPYPISLALSTALYFLSFAVFPVSLTIAVMRHRLYDIDILINRTLVYGALTACIIGLYVLIVGATSTALQASSKLSGFLLATVLVVVIFQPLRITLQRRVDHLMTKEKKEASQSGAAKHSEGARVRETDTNSVSLSYPWRRIARVGWYLLAVVTLSILIASIPGYLYILRHGFYSNLFVVPPTALNSVINFFYVIISLSAVLLSIGLAWVLYRNKPDERMAVFLSFYLLAYGVGFAGPLEVLSFLWPENTIKLFVVFGSALIGPPTMVLFVSFPDGKFVPPWTRWLVLGSIPIIPLSYTFGNAFSTAFPQILMSLSVVLGLGLFLGALYAQFYRYRKVSNFVERQQTKWVIYGFSLWFLFVSVSSFFYARLQSLPPGSAISTGMQLGGLIWGASWIFLPVSLSIAVMRYRLYDVDILINHTLVYGALTASTMGIYVLIVGYLGNLFQAQNSSIIAFLTTGLVALLFQPVRERLQSAVNRLMYGERSNPVSVLSKLGKQLEETPSPREALDAMVATIARTLKLPYVAIEFGQGDKAQVVASFGGAPDETVEFPIGYQGQNIGCLQVAPRSAGESFGEKDKILLENIARQAGAAAQAAKLTSDLRRSRQGLVTAREEERRRLRRDLHDGIGPTMAGQTLKLDAAIDLILGQPESGQKPDLEEAIKMLTEVKEQTQETVKKVRQIVYALRPPSLDDLGLVAAIQTHIDQLSVSRQGLDISLQTSPQDLPHLSAAVEVAAYRIVLEAITNVINHAQAQECVVKLSVPQNEPGMLHLEIKDDGKGIPKGKPAGVGLTSMRERVEELGGNFTIESGQPNGTRILAQIPLFSMEK